MYLTFTGSHNLIWEQLQMLMTTTTMLDATVRSLGRHIANQWCYYLEAQIWNYYIHLTAFFSRTTCVSRHQKGKPFSILMKQEMMGWQWHQLDHMKSFASRSRQMTMPVPHQSVFTARCLPATQPTTSWHWRLKFGSFEKSCKTALAFCRTWNQWR